MSYMTKGKAYKVVNLCKIFMLHLENTLILCFKVNLKLTCYGVTI